MSEQSETPCIKAECCELRKLINEHYGPENTRLKNELSEVTREQTAKETLLNASDAYSNAQWDVEDALEKLFGENTILGIGWDSYDSSLEIYVWQADDLCPTSEQRAAILALGFVQFWINFKDGTERHCSAANTGERRTCTHNRWDCYNQGHLEQRKVERRLAAAERELEELRGKLEPYLHHRPSCAKRDGGECNCGLVAALTPPEK